MLKYNMNLTIGGYPAKQAWHWNHYRYMDLALLVYLMTSSNPIDRRVGLSSYDSLKGHFLQSEWDSIIAVIDKHRSAQGQKNITAIVSDVSGVHSVHSVHSVHVPPQEAPCAH